MVMEWGRYLSEESWRPLPSPLPGHCVVPSLQILQLLGHPPRNCALPIQRSLHAHHLRKKGGVGKREEGEGAGD